MHIQPPTNMVTHIHTNAIGAHGYTYANTATYTYDRTYTCMYIQVQIGTTLFFFIYLSCSGPLKHSLDMSSASKFRQSLCLCLPLVYLLTSSVLKYNLVEVYTQSVSLPHS